jgi:14-3-3 protein epsilon
MISLVNQLVQLSPHLDGVERVRYSQAYHESVISLRSTLLIVQPFLETADTPEKTAAVRAYIDRVRGELRDLCAQVIQTADNRLLPASENAIDHIFYNKMKGDYWRYEAEFETDERRDVAIANADACYGEAMRFAEDKMDIVHPMRLGLVLNYCVFLVDVKGEKETGRRTARAALDRAEAMIAEWNAQRQDADICLKLLRDNLDLWQKENKPEDK